MQKEEPFLSRITFMEKRTRTVCRLCPYMFMFVVYLRSGFFLFTVDCLGWPAQNPPTSTPPSRLGWNTDSKPNLITDISGGPMLIWINGPVFVSVKPLDILKETLGQFFVLLLENPTHQGLYLNLTRLKAMSTLELCYITIYIYRRI